MCKWASNSNTLMEKIEKSEKKLSTTDSNVKCTDEKIKVLGIRWNRNNYILTLDLSTFERAKANHQITKWIILSTIAQF